MQTIRPSGILFSIEIEVWNTFRKINEEQKKSHSQTAEYINIFCYLITHLSPVFLFTTPYIELNPVILN